MQEGCEAYRMKAALIGVGQAGGKVAEALLAEDRRAGYESIRSAFAINTAETDLEGLDIDTMLIGQDRVKGHGVGADNELGAEVMQSDIREVMASTASSTHEPRPSSSSLASAAAPGLAGRPSSSKSSNASTTSPSTRSASSPGATRAVSTRPTRAAR